MIIWLWLGLAKAGVVVTLPGSVAEVEIAESSADAVGLAYSALQEGRFEAAARAFRGLADAGGGGQARRLEAAAWYEAGQLRLAERAAQATLREGDDPEARIILALALIDQGKADDAPPHLTAAEALAQKQGDRRLLARCALARGVVAIDRGEWGEAGALLSVAQSHAEVAGDAGLISIIADNRNTVAAASGTGGSAGDAEGRVVARLRVGDLAGARAAVPRPPEGDRRGLVRSLLADAMVDRVSGDLDAAHTKLRTALGMAREGSMARESAAILGELGTLHALAGRHEEALALLQEAVGVVAGTSLRVRELGLRVEAARVAVRLGDLQQARDQLAVADRLAALVADPLADARRAEVRGLLADAAGDPEAATRQMESALQAYVARGHRLDEARVCTDLAGLWAGRNDGRSASWAVRGEEAFRAAGVRAGPAHVRISQGLGYVKRQLLDEALATFLEAARLGEAAGDARGQSLAREARNLAAAALKALGHTDQRADQMAQATDLTETLARRVQFEKAEADYDDALAAFQRGAYEPARSGFNRALITFNELREPSLAAIARRGRGWATRNLASRLPPEQAFLYLEEAASDGAQVGDSELRARAKVQAAFLSRDLDRRDVQTRLGEAADLAERAGLLLEASRCHAALAEVGDDLDSRAASARRALDLAGAAPGEGAYAMYGVAVDAYNAGAYRLAEELSREALPHSGHLREAVEAVLAASVTASQELVTP